MNFLATIRQQQRARVHTVFALLMFVWLDVALSPCAIAAPNAADPQGQAAHSHMLETETALPDQNPGEECVRCPDCEHEACGELAFCDNATVVSAASEARSADNYQLDLGPAILASKHFNATFAEYRTIVPTAAVPTAATIPLTIRHCVYLK